MKIIFNCMAIAAACFLASCNSKANLAATTDSTAVKLEKNRQTALKAEKEMIAKQIDSMKVLTATNFIDYGSGEDKPMKNIDTVFTTLKEYVTAFPDLKGENLNAFAHGDSVLVIGLWTGTFKNPMMGMKPTGKSFKYNDVDVFTFDNGGKIASHQSIQSSITYFTQLGIKPGAMK